MVPVDDDDEMMRMQVEQRRRLRSHLETEMNSQFDLNENQNDEHSAAEVIGQDQAAHHIEELENYNIYLLNIIKQIKEVVDDNAQNIKNKMIQLKEISKNLDDM